MRMPRTHWERDCRNDIAHLQQIVGTYGGLVLLVPYYAG